MRVKPFVYPINSPRGAGPTAGVSDAMEMKSGNFPCIPPIIRRRKIKEWRGRDSHPCSGLLD